MVTSSGSPYGSYAIAGGEEGKRRLSLLAEIMRPTTLRLLDEAGLRRGDRCLDLGCGGGFVVLDIARIVGPQGHVTGVDFDPQILELARQDARDSGLGNVDYHAADARTFDGGPFDLVYARFLLSHLSEPESVLARIRRLVRPGGRVVVEDTDMSGCFGHRHYRERPVRRALHRKTSRGGGDADLGRRLPVIALAAGLGEVRWNVFQPVHVSGAHKHMTAVTMERIRPAVLRHGLATDRRSTTSSPACALRRVPRRACCMVQVWELHNMHFATDRPADELS